MENLYEKFLEILEDHPEIDEMFYPWSECQVGIYEIPRGETEITRSPVDLSPKIPPEKALELAEANARILGYVLPLWLVDPPGTERFFPRHPNSMIEVKEK